MRVPPDQIEGVRLIEGMLHQDERGHFVKAAVDGDLEPDRSVPSGRQLCSSHNRRAGTVRGLHYQAAPYAESKLVWCVAGAVWDVLVDVRPTSATYGDWAGVHLDGAVSLRVPAGVAHGFQTLVDDSVIVYLIDGVFSAAHARTLLWDDPTVGIDWPLAASVVSASDRTGSRWPAES